MAVYAGPDVSENGLVLALDAANKKSYSQNEFQNSTDIFAWCGSSGHYNATISRDTISSPVGNTPLKMAVTGDDPHLGTYNSAPWNIAPALNGETWIVSVYVKANVATTGEILIFGANSSGVGFVNGAWLSLTATTVNIGTEWTRVQHVHTMNNADVAYIHVRLDGPNSGGTGQTVWWDGLQVERVPSGTTTPTPFTSSYYGGSVYRDLIGSNNGTLTNRPTYSSSNNGSLVFDGVDDYVTNGSTDLSVANNLFADSSGSWSVSAWFKFPVSPTQTRDDNLNGGNCSYSIVGRSGGIATGATFTLFVAGASTTYGSFLNKCVAGIRGTNTQISSTSVNTNTWYNVTVTWDSTNAFGYLNGSNQTSLGVGSASLQSYDLTVGNTASLNTPSTGYHNFEGSIANVSIYNRALTPSEVQQNFNATRRRFGI